MMTTAAIATATTADTREQHLPSSLVSFILSLFLFLTSILIVDSYYGDTATPGVMATAAM
jgi:hypothetical protein